MNILSHKQIESKIKRLAYQILEQYIDEKELYIFGINNNGAKLRNELSKTIQTIEPTFKLYIQNIKVNPASPLSSDVQVDLELKELMGKNILIIDDVASTGRTLFYAASKFQDTLAKSIKVCVLVDRKHKSFPIQVDFVGLSLATTIHDNILVHISRKSNWYCELV